MHFTLNESAIISARSRKGAEFSGTWLLDPHNLWVYNLTNPATTELPGTAGAGGKYSPEANMTSTAGTLKFVENKSATDSYISDKLINDKLNGIEVQLTASGNITVTSNVTICSTSSNKFIINISPVRDQPTGNIVIKNAKIDVKKGVSLQSAGNVTVVNSSIMSAEGTVAAVSSKQGGLVNISNSNFSGKSTALAAMLGNIEVVGGNLNATEKVVISASSSNGNATLSGVSVNTPDVNVTGSNITLDNATLNVTPGGSDKGINIGMGSTPAKTVVIKNSTLNTTGGTQGVINVQGTEQDQY